jgi:hypothetical protein
VEPSRAVTDRGRALRAPLALGPLLLAGLAGCHGPTGERLTLPPAPPAGAPGAAVIRVTSAADDGEGSLRQALLRANASAGPETIRFDPEGFASPRRIELASALPEIAGELVIDGYIERRLWQASGATLSGEGKLPVLRVAPGARVTLRHLTIAEGRARDGAGIENRGELVLESLTFAGNVALRDGGALLNRRGSVWLVNSTLVGNRAGRGGGAVSNEGGRLTVTNCTLAGNAAGRGAGLLSSGDLLLRNSILADSGGGEDCLATGGLDARSTHNLIESGRGCGEPISTADPLLGALGRYNGPTATLALESGSPAINLGDNDSARDARDEPLRWDQRGNGDPRFVAGFTDLGAFEYQALPVLVVDTAEDNGLRACTRAGAQDCPLRGAIELANAKPGPDVIRFDPRVFSEPVRLRFARDLPEVTGELALDARGTGGVSLAEPRGALRAAPEARLTLHEVSLEAGR